MSVKHTDTDTHQQPHKSTVRQTGETDTHPKSTN